MSLPRVLFLLSLAALLGACAERSGCPAGDLAAFGRAEGERGELPSLPSATCELDEGERDRNHAARALGLGSWCDAQRGFDAGLRGEEPAAEACPLDRRDVFSRAVQTGSFLLQKESEQQQRLQQAQELEANAEAADDPEKADEWRAQARSLRMDARQAENDLEALRGVAIVEGWMASPSIPEQAQPPADPE